MTPIIISETIYTLPFIKRELGPLEIGKIRCLSFEVFKSFPYEHEEEQRHFCA